MAFCPTDGLEIDRDKCRDCTTRYSGPQAAVGSRDGLNRSGGLCKEGGSIRAPLEPGCGRRCRRIGSKQLSFPRLRRLLAGLLWFFVQPPRGSSACTPHASRRVARLKSTWAADRHSMDKVVAIQVVRRKFHDGPQAI